MIINFNQKIDDKEITHLSLRLWNIRESVEYFTDYIGKNESFLKDESVKIWEGFDEYKKAEKEKYAISGLEEDLQFEAHIQSMYENEEYLIGNMERSFAEATLIQVISFIELELKKICEKCYTDNKTGYKISELAGKGDFEKAKLFLSKTCEINFGSIKEWNFIMNMKEIRNKIVHNGGKVSEESTIKNFIKGKSSIDTDFSNIITFNDNDLNKELIINSLLFFEKIIVDLENLYDKKDN